MARPTKEEMQARAAHMRAKRMEKLEAQRKQYGLQPGQKLSDILEEEEELEDPRERMTLSEHTWLGEPGKSLYIPSWYRAHRKNVEVTQNGVRLGFDVKSVMEHRRWAVKADGELLPQEEFERLYEVYLDAIRSKEVDPRLQHIPRVERYVNARPDPSGGPGFVAITFNPDAPPAVDDGMRYDPTENVIWSLKEEMERGSRVDQINALFRLFKAGDLTPEAYMREMALLSPDLAKDEPKAETPQEVAAPVA